MAHGGMDKKPTVVFLARFFLGGVDRRLPLKGNGLRGGKQEKAKKTQKKVQNNFRGTGVFPVRSASRGGQGCQKGRNLGNGVQCCGLLCKSSED
jgi:hypothetical protein